MISTSTQLSALLIPPQSRLEGKERRDGQASPQTLSVPAAGRPGRSSRSRRRCGGQSSSLPEQRLPRPRACAKSVSELHRDLPSQNGSSRHFRTVRPLSSRGEPGHESVAAREVLVLTVVCNQAWPSRSRDFVTQQRGHPFGHLLPARVAQDGVVHPRTRLDVQAVSTRRNRVPTNRQTDPRD